MSDTVAHGAIPVIDLEPFATGADAQSPQARDTAARLDVVLRDVGFLTVVGHGVSTEVRRAFFDMIRRFFDQPEAKKQEIAISNSPYHRGYGGFAAETLEGAIGAQDEDTVGTFLAGDMKETLDFAVDHPLDHPEVVAGTPLHGPNQYPDIPGFREVWETYRAAVTEAAVRMQRALAVALGLDAEFFISQPGETMYHLRMIHYPPMDRLTPEPGQMGCGAHTDYGTLTVLADDGIGGLQVRQRNGEWTDVAVPDGHLVVNLGDLMAIWTNGRWVSNPHRVVNPPNQDRYSSPLFVTPPYHLRIEALESCLANGEQPTHEPLVSGEYLVGRFDGTHSYRNEMLEQHNSAAQPSQ